LVLSPFTVTTSVRISIRFEPSPDLLGRHPLAHSPQLVLLVALHNKITMKKKTIVTLKIFCSTTKKQYVFYI